MISKSELKDYSSLLHKKFRMKEKKFLVEGIKLINEARDSGFQCEIILCTHEFSEKKSNLDQISQIKSVRNEVVKNSEFNKLTDTQAPAGVVGIFKFQERQKQVFGNEDLIIGLENISDPGNLGAVIRNCDWFGIKEIIVSPGSAEIFSPKVVRSSAGSAFHLNVIETDDFYRDLTKLRNDNYEVLCADLTGENIYKFRRSKKSIVVFANEANGPSEKILKLVDHSITIPKQGEVESLNVASASAVILSELSKV